MGVCGKEGQEWSSRLEGDNVSRAGVNEHFAQHCPYDLTSLCSSGPLPNLGQAMQELPGFKGLPFP